MRVVLDSSVITERDWQLTSAAATALLSAARRAQLQLAVPEVVIREVSAKLKEREEQTLRKVNDSRAALRKLQLAFSQDARSADDYRLVADKIEEDLRNRLHEARVQILPVPDVPHSDLVNRALARRRPFDKQGRSGYRDALIWYSVLEGAGPETVTVFGTANSSDFSDNKAETRVHPDLAQDLEQRGLTADAVILADSLDAVVRLVLEPANALLQELRDLLQNDDAWRNELETSVKTLIETEGSYTDDSDVDVQIEDGGIPFSEDVEHESLEYIEYQGGLAITDAWAGSNSEFVVELSARVEATYDLEVSTSRFWRKPELVPAGLALSPDERHATFSGFADAVAHIQGRYSRSGRGIDQLSIQHLSS